MRKREFDESFNDILEAINDLEEFTNGVSFEQFIQNKEKIFAVEKALEIIGEAVKNIPDEIRDKYPHITCKSIAGMRDKLVHEYWGIDIEVVWKVIKNYVPILKDAIIEIVNI
ncbi:MAG TPA: DUF86 domain-containing protein [Allocoleopsis sp.]